MTLVGVTGRRKNVNQFCVFYALEKSPSLIIDCANVADPHRFYGKVSDENFSRVYVLIAEAVHRYRDTVKEIPRLVDKTRAKTIVITMFDRLFDYGDHEENNNVFAHSWELLKKFSTDIDIIVAVPEKQLHHAQRFCDDIRNIQEEDYGTHSIKPKKGDRQTDKRIT